MTDFGIRHPGRGFRFERPAQVDDILVHAGSLLRAGWSREHFSTSRKGEPRPFDAADVVNYTTAHAVQRSALDVVGVRYERAWYFCVHFVEEAMRQCGWTSSSLPVWGDFDADESVDLDDVIGLLDLASRIARSAGYTIPPDSRLVRFISS